jgi:hypothetical protein
MSKILFKISTGFKNIKQMLFEMYSPTNQVYNSIAIDFQAQAPHLRKNGHDTG